MHGAANSTLNGTAEKVGAGVETIGEFLAGDAALKGLSVADKLTKISGVMKYVEQFPRLDSALKLGINIGKAGAELSPEERELLRAHPVIARLVGVGYDAIRAGTVQAGQTAVKTGGNVPEALKSGAEMAVGSAALGAPLAYGSHLLESGVEAANATKTLRAEAQNAPTAAETNTALESKVQQAVQPVIDAAQTTKNQMQTVLNDASTFVEKAGQNAPTKEAIATQAQNAVKNAETSLNSNYELAFNNINDQLQGITVPVKESPVQTYAQELLTGPNEGDRFKKAIGLSLPVSDKVSGVLQEFAKEGEEGESFTSNNLLDLAKLVKESIL